MKICNKRYPRLSNVVTVLLLGGNLRVLIIRLAKIALATLLIRIKQIQ